MNPWIRNTLVLLGLLLSTAATADPPRRAGVSPPLCSQGTSAERAACLKQAVERLSALGKPRVCGDPRDAGTGPSPCFLNNVDSTCHYASGVKSDICQTPRCAHGSKVYSDGSCADDDLCPADTPRAGLPPDPMIGCGVSQPGAGGEGFKAKGFLLKPGEGRSEKWTYYVGSGQRVLMSATVQSSIHGRPIEEAQEVVDALGGAGWVIEQGGNAPALMRDMVAAFSAHRKTGSGLGGQRLGFVSFAPPPLLEFVGGMVENSPTAEASATGSGESGGYGYVTFLGTIENRFPSSVAAVWASLEVPAVTVPGSCPATPSVPPALPANSEYLVLDSAPRFSESGCRENLQCDGSSKLEGCRVVSATTSGRWSVRYQILGPNLWVTDVLVESNGGPAFSY